MYLNVINSAQLILSTFNGANDADISWITIATLPWYVIAYVLTYCGCSYFTRKDYSIIYTKLIKPRGDCSLLQNAPAFCSTNIYCYIVSNFVASQWACTSLWSFGDFSGTSSTTWRNICGRNAVDMVFKIFQLMYCGGHWIACKV